MTSNDIIVGFYDSTGMLHFARGGMYDAWVIAGRPNVNSSARPLDSGMQQAAWNAYQNGTGSPADDPSRPALFALGHVRAAALDIDPTDAVVAGMTAAGMERPFSYEPWHWAIPNVRAYPLVYSIPQYAIDNAIPYDTMEGFPMAQYHWAEGRGGILFTDLGVYVPKDANEAGALAKCYGGSVGNKSSRRLDSTDIDTATWDIVRQVHLDIRAAFLDEARTVPVTEEPAPTDPVVVPPKA